MNRERVKALRKFMAKLPPKAIYMGEWIKCDRPGETIKQARQHTCGTQACIAGWAVLAFHRYRESKISEGGGIGPRQILPEYIAAKLLGLTEDEADNLFLGEWATNPVISRDLDNQPVRRKNLTTLTKADVLKQLDYMLKTGEI